MKKRISTAAYLAGVTSLAVTLPMIASAGTRDAQLDEATALKKMPEIQVKADEDQA